MDTLFHFIEYIQQDTIIVMFLVFLVIFGWAYWPSNKPAMEQHAHIILDDDR